MTDLGTLGGDECYPADINNGGQIVGTVTLPDGDVRAFVWENGMMTSLAPNRSSKAVAINEFGDIIGFEKDPDRSCGDTFCATLWTHGHRIDLRRGGVGFADGMLQAINNEGQIVGYGGPPASPNQFEGRKPLLWVDGVLTELGTAQGTVPNYATLLNNRGLIIVDQDDRPTLWWDGMLYPLPIPDVSEARQLWGTAAMGISDSGYVAGATLSGRAFRWKVELPE
jgi:probable HAF family extracellular repeat protein